MPYRSSGIRPSVVPPDERQRGHHRVERPRVASTAFAGGIAEGCETARIAAAVNGSLLAKPRDAEACEAFCWR